MLKCHGQFPFVMNMIHIILLWGRIPMVPKFRYPIAIATIHTYMSLLFREMISNVSVQIAPLVVTACAASYDVVTVTAMTTVTRTMDAVRRGANLDGWATSATGVS